MISTSENLSSPEREVPRIETAPILTTTISKPDESVDIEHYRRMAQHANDLFLQHQKQENTMNPIIASPKTSLAGIAAAAPLFVIGIGALIAGDVGGGIGHILAAVGVLFGLLQAQDASKVADVVKQIIPKPQPQAPTE